MPNQTVPDKTMPYNLEAEGAVLADDADAFFRGAR